MGAYDDPLGSILIGTWVSSLLFMLIIQETIRYYRSFKRDSLVLKTFVGVAITVDAVSLIADYADVYLYTISHWGDEEFLKNQYWPVTLYLATTAVTAFLVQCFLVNRYWILTRNIVVASILVLLVIVAFGSSMSTAIMLTIYNAYADRHHAKVPVTLWLTSTAVTDIAIATVLIWQLYNMKTSFKATEGLIQRLMRSAMQTGSTTSIVAVLVLITYLVNNESNIETGFAFILGRLYILTLLYNLNVRKVSKNSNAASSDREYRVERANNPTFTFDGIHVQHTAVVHMDSIDGGLPSRASPSIYKAQDLTRTDDDNKDKSEGGSDRGSYAAQSAIDKV
ncbi:hypothetical protein ARMSODRAFT_200918 [Armillaria solidipes]|uniref:DUF6534 domain-containing protein n=1 Tax=Armillaria solidipes TaxID=1076256 RepID=A0A2H3BDJ8_9AGAR|nr:hypothetical protein ARMSODRAFT_200918 [Armillaria solidipes]